MSRYVSLHGYSGLCEALGNSILYNKLVSFAALRLPHYTDI